jgi:hypothetical protein
VGEAPRRLSQRPLHVEVPDDKRPRDGDCLKRLRQEVSLSSIELAPSQHRTISVESATAVGVGGQFLSTKNTCYVMV